jgi:hypothetical protein
VVYASSFTVNLFDRPNNVEVREERE